MTEIETLLFGGMALLCIFWASHVNKKNREIGALKKRLDALLPPKSNLDTTENTDEAKPLANEAPVQSPSARPQTPAVRRMLERLHELENPPPKEEPRTSPSTGATKSSDFVRPRYNPAVWKEVNGKMVLRDTSELATRRRQDSVKLSKSSPFVTCTQLSGSSLVVHSDPRD